MYASHAAQDDRGTPFPIEVYENIMDMVLVLRYKVLHVNTLRSCALVCRAWRIRAQRNLVYSVILLERAELRGFSASLNKRPYLWDHVHEISLQGRTYHSAADPLSVFPILLRKASRLRILRIQYIPEEIRSFPVLSDQFGVEPLGYLALHPRFPLYLSAFKTITSLYFFDVTFHHINDLLGIVKALQGLRYLHCGSVKLATLPSLPMSTKLPGDVDHGRAWEGSPNFQELELVRTRYMYIWFACDTIYPE